MSRYEQLKAAQQRYASKCKFIHLRLNRARYGEIIDWIDKQPNVTQSICDLIREKIKSETE